MSNTKKNDWSPLPPDRVALIFSPLIIAGIAILTTSLFWRLLRGGVLAVFAVGVGAGIIGVVLLFLARLPLYRSGQFPAFGPRLLDAPHRRLYRWAYRFVVVSVLVLALLLVFLCV
jgi:hypothetical protein